MVEAPRHWGIIGSASARRRETASRGDTAAYGIIATASLLIAAALAWIALDLAPDRGPLAWLAMLAGFWAGAFAFVALRALVALARRFSLR